MNMKYQLPNLPVLTKHVQLPSKKQIIYNGRTIHKLMLKTLLLKLILSQKVILLKINHMKNFYHGYRITRKREETKKINN